MEPYTIVIVVVLIASIFGAISYRANEHLFALAWSKGKYFRTIFLAILHGPIVWLSFIKIVILFLFFIVQVLSALILREKLED